MIFICDIKIYIIVYEPLCVKNFFVNLLFSTAVWLVEIWHLFDNLTSMTHFDILAHDLNHLSLSQNYFSDFLLLGWRFWAKVAVFLWVLPFKVLACLHGFFALALIGHTFQLLAFPLTSSFLFEHIWFVLLYTLYKQVCSQGEDGLWW